MIIFHCFKTSTKRTLKMPPRNSRSSNNSEPPRIWSSADVFIHTDEYHRICLATGAVRFLSLVLPLPLGVIWHAVVGEGAMDPAPYLALCALQVLPFVVGWLSTRYARQNLMLLFQLWLLVQAIVQAWIVWYPMYSPEASLSNPSMRFSAQDTPSIWLRVVAFPYLEAPAVTQLPLPGHFFDGALAVLRTTGYNPAVIPDTAHLLYFVGLIFCLAGYEQAKRSVDRIAADKRRQASLQGSEPEPASDGEDEEEVEPVRVPKKGKRSAAKRK
ncbi:hypothetical protein BC828DRAFT_131430 [Blastocladiella britannica]|nr:hypothetical protein BC828DRAFT_131430 [Blastocladiella britannica]